MDLVTYMLFDLATFIQRETLTNTCTISLPQMWDSLRLWSNTKNLSPINSN